MANETNVRLPAASVLIGTRQTEFASELGVPDPSTNLFQRMIRNPRAGSDLAKERECTEMLCVLLQNAPAVRRAILSWMARKARIVIPPGDELSMTLDTEQWINTKRDDLRISGWDSHARQRLLWTVEVKVGASFHRSGRLESALGGAAEENANVSQITNYDSWLVKQPAECRAGFILSLHDCTESLPSHLQCCWTCLTWTGMGEELARAIVATELPSEQLFLAKHVLGFIRDNLWRASEMSDVKLDFNDVALIRAFGLLADECVEKVDRLVKPLCEVLQQSGLGKGAAKHHKSLFKTDIAASFASLEIAENVELCAGIGGYEQGDFASVWLESHPKHAGKDAFRQALIKLAKKLQGRDPAWKLTFQDSTSALNRWVDVELTVSLAALLVASDQQEALKRFVEKAILDMRDCGVLDAFKRTIGSA